MLFFRTPGDHAGGWSDDHMVGTLLLFPLAFFPALSFSFFVVGAGKSRWRWLWVDGLFSWLRQLWLARRLWRRLPLRYIDDLCTRWLPGTRVEMSLPGSSGSLPWVFSRLLTHSPGVRVRRSSRGTFPRWD